MEDVTPFLQFQKVRSLLDDQRSIQKLTDETAKCFDHEKLRALYVAVHVPSLNLMVDLATYHTMRIFKFAVKWSGPHNAARYKGKICNAVAGSFVVSSLTLSTVNIVESMIWKDSDYHIGDGMGIGNSPPVGISLIPL